MIPRWKGKRRERNWRRLAGMLPRRTGYKEKKKTGGKRGNRSTGEHDGGKLEEVAEGEAERGIEAVGAEKEDEEDGGLKTEEVLGIHRDGVHEGAEEGMVLCFQKRREVRGRQGQWRA